MSKEWFLTITDTEVTPECHSHYCAEEYTDRGTIKQIIMLWKEIKNKGDGEWK